MSDSDIRKDFQKKLGGYEVPVPPDSWDRVERSLDAAAVREILHRRWLAGAVAAVLVLLVGGIFFLPRSLDMSDQVAGMINPLDDKAQDTEQNSTPGKVDSAQSLQGYHGKSQPLVASVLVRKGQKVKSRNQALIPSVSPADPVVLFDEVLSGKSGSADSLKGNVVVEEIYQQNRSTPERHADGTIPEEEVIVVKKNPDMLLVNDDRGAPQTNKGVVLLAVSGRGGMSGYQQMVNTPMTLRSAVDLPEGKIPLEAGKATFVAADRGDNVSEMEHDQPLSFGITVSKYLSDDLFVETGLVYSYLYSKMRNSNNSFKVEEVQKLHYLGIPLTVNYNIFSFNKLCIYASMGGMIEKDVYGEFSKISEGQVVNLNSTSGESEENENKRISQKNPQISVNAGVGLSYPVYDRLKIYGKIGGAYYFDAKNQYKTIYSDRKIVMDLNLGLRYEF